MNLADARRAAREGGDFAPLLKRIPYVRWLGATASLDNSSARLTLPYTAMLTGNPALPALHGGVVASAMECAAVLELLLRLDLDRVPKSIDVSIDYLRPALTQTLHTECVVERIGRRIAQTTMRCWQDDPARPVAVARGHFLLSEMPE
jgi:uncharacterized protein (TIGR00369 family)